MTHHVGWTRWRHLLMKPNSSWCRSMVNFISPHDSKTDIVQEKIGRVIYTQLNRNKVKMTVCSSVYLWMTLCSSWETMLIKSTERLTDAELRCCRRLVQLCQDCLLTVYCCATNAATLKHPPRTTPLPWMKNNTRPTSTSSLPLRTLLASSFG